MIEGSNCKERKLSFSTLIGLWVSTSRRISVLSMNPTRFPAPTTGLWYWEEESPACTTRATDASQREEQGTEHCGALGIFLVLDRRSISSSAARSGNSPCRVVKGKVEKGKPKNGSRGRWGPLYIYTLQRVGCVLPVCLPLCPHASHSLGERHRGAHAPGQPPRS